MKRRLQLMPEVLPAPSKTATSAVRERTMARLRVLAAVGTGIAAACGGATTGSGDGNGKGPGRDGGLPDPNKPDSDPGYGVVDPLPPPACFDYATEPTATAKFVDAKDVDAGAPDGGKDGRWIQVIVMLNQKDVAVGDIQVSGVTLVEKELKDGEVDLLLYGPSADVEAIEAYIQIQTSCAKGPTRVSVSVTEPDKTTPKLETQVSFYGGR